MSSQPKLAIAFAVVFLLFASDALATTTHLGDYRYLSNYYLANYLANWNGSGGACYVKLIPYAGSSGVDEYWPEPAGGCGTVPINTPLNYGAGAVTVKQVLSYPGNYYYYYNSRNLESYVPVFDMFNVYGIGNNAWDSFVFGIVPKERVDNFSMPLVTVYSNPYNNITNIGQATQYTAMPILTLSWCGEHLRLVYTKTTAAPTNTEFSEDGSCPSGLFSKLNQPAGDPYLVQTLYHDQNLFNANGQPNGQIVKAFFGTQPNIKQIYTLPLQVSCSGYAEGTYAVSDTDWNGFLTNTTPFGFTFVRVLPKINSINDEYKDTKNSNTFDIMTSDTNGYLSGITIDMNDGSPDNGGTYTVLYCLNPSQYPEPDSYKPACETPYGWPGAQPVWNDAVDTLSSGNACCGDDGNADVGQLFVNHDTGDFYMCQAPSGVYSWRVGSMLNASNEPNTACPYYTDGVYPYVHYYIDNGVCISTTKLQESTGKLVFQTEAMLGYHVDPGLGGPNETNIGYLNLPNSKVKSISGPGRLLAADTTFVSSGASCTSWPQGAPSDNIPTQSYAMRAEQNICSQASCNAGTFLAHPCDTVMQTNISYMPLNASGTLTFTADYAGRAQTVSTSWSNQPYCGNGVQDPGENPINCPEDFPLQCPTGTGWSEAVGECIPAVCGDPNLGTTDGINCNQFVGTTPDHYCSDGPNQDDGNPATGTCCPTNTVWNGVLCLGTSECYNAPCPYTTADSRYYTTPACVSTSANAGNPGACCNVGTKYGVTPYYDYSTSTGSTTNNFQIY